MTILLTEGEIKPIKNAIDEIDVFVRFFESITNANPNSLTATQISQLKIKLNTLAQKRRVAGILDKLSI